MNSGPYDPYYGIAGGIYDGDGTLTIDHSTIAGNSCLTDGGGVYGRGGESTIHMHNTIVGGNVSGSGVGKDLRFVVLTSSGYNLISDSAGGGGYDDTDILDVDPLLGPVADNGGLTLTMALLPDSPAIDAGDPNITNAPEFDQRGPGFPRIVNGRIDIGAFEVQATNAPLPRGARRGSSDSAVFITADFEDEHTLIKEPIDETTIRTVAFGTA